jgi:ABC-type glycerol-3-phosphate transport system substrate-binding protein
VRRKLSKQWYSASVFLLLIGALAAWVTLSDNHSDFSEKYRGENLSRAVIGIGRQNTYAVYLQRYEETPDALESISISLKDYVQAQGVHVQFDNDGQPVLLTQEGSDITWKIEVPQEGMYRLNLEYLTLPSRGVDVERALYINGEVPFLGADKLLFSRMWTDAGAVRTDNQGNQIRPAQQEVFFWQTVDFKDPLGYETAPYRFYFSKGENTLRLVGTNEPMVLRSLTLGLPEKAPVYMQYYEAAKSTAGQPSGVLSDIPGEAAQLRSSPSLYARYDRSSPATVPSDLSRVVLNYIGGDSWRIPGQWIQWDIEVPEDGLYLITIKGRQRYQRGSKSSRTLLIDGKIPFEEVSEIPFEFANAWEMKTLSDEHGEPYMFYLSEGTHTIRLEATLGGMGAILTQLDDSVYRLNQIYRKILILTGVNPDTFRDYNIHQVYPEVVEAMALESKRLYEIVDEAAAYTGQKSDKIAAAQTLATQLEEFSRDPNRITASFVNFKDNITALGTAMQAMGEIKLDIDSIFLHSADRMPASEKENVVAGLWHEIKSTIISYFVDYDALGDVFDDEDALEVWLLTGRDQSTVLKTMVDDSFTPKTGIKVNIKLVDPSALLGAVVAGNGPDLVVSTDSWNPVNYALRKAAEDLTQFDNFDEVISRFRPSAYASLSWDGGVYGLPETQVVSVLFYRSDILEEYGMQAPETWDELIGLMPTIQGNNMSVGIPYPSIAAPNQSTLYSLIYQLGGQIYTPDATRTLLNEEPAVQAFDFFTSLYTDYGLPKEFDFISRFRSGEMPLGIADFTTFNFLAVSAPEIRGLWDFCLIPGTPRMDSDGGMTIDHAVHSQGVSCMMIATTDESVKQKAWAFMTWWTDRDAQVRFGREIEAVLGASARYPTANIAAMRELSWSASQITVLETALDEAVGFREVAGGYYTARNITNAVRKVINNLVNPRETILDYARLIDREITNKRLEFGLSVSKGVSP